jgi:hypothetical protein
MRKLATIQKIKSLTPIAGKDKIVLARFEDTGWQVIVGKDMNVGDLCVYVEYDSILPEKSEFEFLRSRCWCPRFSGFRIKCMKMGGVFSEGIAFPMSILPEGHWHTCDDVTERLDITKYDPELLDEKKESGPSYPFLLRLLFRIPLIKKLFFNKKDRGWPKWASKSDETRIQNLSYVFDKYQSLNVVLTEKMDGCSALYGLRKGKLYVCSRNLQVKKAKGKYAKEQSRYIRAAEMFDIKNKLKKAQKIYGYEYYVQGELCGPGIQGNKYGFSDLCLFVFNVYSITQKQYLAPFELQNFCHELGFESVPFLRREKFQWKNVDEIVESAKGKSLYGDTPREGIVVRSEKWMPPDILMSNMWSLKTINPDFMIKYGL